MNNKTGCEYCNDGKYIRYDYSGKKLLCIIPDGEYALDWKMKEVDYCFKCGRNLKTGNEMVEVKPLEFPSWEEFQKKRYFREEINEINYSIKIKENTKIEVKTKKEGNKTTTKRITTVINEYIIAAFGKDCDGCYSCVIPELYERFESTEKGYNQACEEIERIRMKFIKELVEG